MLPEHLRSGMAHHGFDLFTAFPLVAMHRTLGTGVPIKALERLHNQFLESSDDTDALLDAYLNERIE